ncbi:MAG TPA: acylneuraminate cytidylyltransferase family protein [Noviherbaspirillum sp.]|uniref:acylneuraminate cytidylyltransferase family protein n=1 Tax=Noviherbaspirillum sp. TaxID=1926288 RepID=UPI002B4A3334|nr:acylneuraminate cytidylyltransferase family protein [Noviherbaspirillum sp.]HJV88511.1 acylneuraminate cytidylyltransferase family protein [Noviherbaspirillum sp.]
MAINNHVVIGLIPARGGSKGVLRKNLRMIGGKPLVGFTIQAALSSRYIDATYLSSDDDEILAYGENNGVKPMRRPSELSSDTASAVGVVKHFLDALQPHLVGQDPYIVYLQPTSPLRSGIHIDAALLQMMMQQAHSLMSVVEMAKSPFKSFSLDDHGRLKSIFDEAMSNQRRQDLPKAYMPNGAIYVFRSSEFLSKGGFPSNGSVPFMMSQDESIDIDTEEDVRHIEYILKERNG